MTPEQKFVKEAAGFIKKHGYVSVADTVTLDDGREVTGKELDGLVMDAIDIATGDSNED